MNFQLTKEQEFVQKMVREFAKTEVEPLAAEIDQEHRFPVETVEKMAKYGLLGIPFPTKYGGMGGDEVSYSITVSELAKVCASTSVIVSAHTSLCCWPIYKYGTEDQKMKYLPELLSGKKLGAFGLTEPNAGTDASGQQTRAELDGDEWVLNGAKCFITNGGYAEVFVVMAMTDKSKGNHGISAFIVEKNDPGFSIVRLRTRWVSVLLQQQSLFSRTAAFLRTDSLVDLARDLRLLCRLLMVDVSVLLHRLSELQRVL